MAETVSVLITLGVFAFVLFPLRTPSWMIPTNIAGGKSNERKELKEKKASLLLALRELDFDYEMGKLSAEDYKGLRAKYQADAVSVMKNLDEIEAEWQEVQAKIDEDLASSLGKSKKKPTSSAKPKFCSKCGKPLQNQDRFCGHCGFEFQVKAYA